MDKLKHVLLKDLFKTNIEGLSLFQILSNNNAIIAGGAVTSVFCNRDINDYDIYFKSAKDYEEVSKILNKNDKLICSTNMAETFKIDNVVIQLIRNFIYDNISDLLNEFDFSICMGAYDIVNDEFILSNKFLIDNLRKEITFNTKTKFPICSLCRLRKYLDRGYKINGDNIIKLALSINNLNLSDYPKLREQLIGVDTNIIEDLSDNLFEFYFNEEYYNGNEDYVKSILYSIEEHDNFDSQIY